MIPRETFMRHLTITGLCLLFVTLAVPVHAQVDWQVQGGPRLWLNGGGSLTSATVGADVVLARGVFIGADTTIRPSLFGLMGQLGYQTRQPQLRGIQGYVVAGVGVGLDDSSREFLTNVGGGIRVWLAPRVAPFVDFRQLFINDSDVNGALEQLSFGLTVRLGQR
jgi:hypothetical protein